MEKSQSLPIVTRPSYSFELSGFDKKVVYEPFTVADRRSIMMAREMRDFDMFINSVVQITSKNSNLVELGAMKLHYIEYTFLKIYAASKGNVIESTFTCQNEGCGHEMNIKIPLEKARIDYGNLSEDKVQLIKLSDKIGVELEIPDWEKVSKFVTEKGLDIGDKFVLSCIKGIIADDTYLNSEDYTDDELKEWIDNLPDYCSDKFGDFFSNIPILTLSLPITCPMCKKEHLLALRGLDDFFI